MATDTQAPQAYVALPCDCDPPKRHGQHFRAIDQEGGPGEPVPLRPNRADMRGAVLGRDRKRQESLAGDEWHESAFTAPALASRRIRRRPRLAARAARARENAAKRASVTARRESVRDKAALAALAEPIGRLA